MTGEAVARLDTDILILGSGGAGLFAAVRAAPVEASNAFTMLPRRGPFSVASGWPSAHTARVPLPRTSSSNARTASCRRAIASRGASDARYGVGHS